MKTTSARSFVTTILSLLLAGSHLADADRDRFRVTHDGISFLVDRYDDGRAKPFAVTFTDAFRSVYKFDAEGSVIDIKTDDETYNVIYTNNGDLKKVKDTTSTRRILTQNAGEIEGGDISPADDETLDAEEERPTPSDKTNHRRRLYDCEDCTHTWNTLCNEGVETVCALEDYGHPLQPTADMSIHLFCGSFASACSEFSASDVCDEECEEEEQCLPPLTITLEWSGDPDDADQDVAHALDLYVIEPAGTTVFWSNTQSATAELYTETYKRTYTVFQGLDPSDLTTTTTGSGTSPSISGTESEGMELVNASGSYIAFAEWWTGDAPIYWTMTATAGNGEIMAEVEGQFTGDCDSSSTSTGLTSSDLYGHGVSKLVYMYLSEYVDNNCDAPTSSSPSYR